MQMKQFGMVALSAGLTALLLQGCLEAPSSVSENQPQSEAIAAQSVAAIAAGPDLVFTSARVTRYSSTGYTYTYTIKNQGTVNIADLYSVSIQNFYSANTIFNDAGDVAAGGSILGVHVGLAAGASYSGSFKSSGPLPAGMNYVTFKIDWGNAVAETNETNNTSALLVRPDLVFTTASVTGSSAAGFTYSYTIKNQGGDTIPDLYNVSIQNFYSTNTIFNDAGDVAAGGSILGVHVGLPPNATYSGTFHSSGALPAGMNYLTFKIDWGNAVAELNENNNTYALLVRPDLQFTSAVITARTANQVKYSYTIKNTGTVAIPDLYNVSIQNFYSVNTVFNDAGDVAAGGSILGVHVALAAGASYSGTFAASGAVPAGFPYLTFKIDWGNSVTESNENNNTVALLIP
jgi:trimeric autotransporter adhesin